MKFEQKTRFSYYLGQEMHVNRYGDYGKPVIVFPSSGGSQNEYADFGMIEACKEFINHYNLVFYTPDSYDKESWLSDWKSGHDMGLAHDAYERYIIEELVPMIKVETGWAGKLLATGCSMGAFHTINFALKYPEIFDVAIAQSGVYDARFFTGDYYGDLSVYYNSPIDYLSQDSNENYLEQLRQNHWIISVGQGAWEGPHIQDTQRLESVFSQKNIPAWFDYWGQDVSHDWIWWRVQIPYFLNILREKCII